jgi:hypothetical protein
MWSDTLMAAERLMLLRMLLWAAAATLTGTLLLLVLTMRRRPPGLLTSFAGWLAAVGLGLVAGGLLWWRTIGPRDVAGAERLDDLLWFLLGLDAGLALAAAAVVLLGWRAARTSLMGGGCAALVHALALLLVHAQSISRLATLRVT